MNLIPKTTAQLVAERIDAIQSELLRHVESQLAQIYSLVNTPDEQQAILDCFASPAKAVMDYAAMQAAVAAINPATSAPVPDQAVFQIQPDGSVLYVAPPVPEPIVTDLIDA